MNQKSYILNSMAPYTRLNLSSFGIFRKKLTAATIVNSDLFVLYMCLLYLTDLSDEQWREFEMSLAADPEY